MALYEDFVIDEATRRVDTLEAFVDRLGAFRDEIAREEFTKLFKEAAVILELSDDDLARMFKISRPTAGRWARGDAAPHTLGRKAVFDVLGREAKKKKRTIDNRFQPVSKFLTG